MRGGPTVGIVLVVFGVTACGKSSRTERGDGPDEGPAKVAAFHLIEPLAWQIEEARNATTPTVLRSRVSFVSDDLESAIGVSHLHVMAGTVHVEPIRWTLAGGTVELGALPGADPKTDLSGVSDIDSTGSTVVGSALDASGVERAFRWTEATGMVNISPPGSSRAYASLVNDDGSVVAGRFSVVGSEQLGIFRWTSASGAVDLGSIPGVLEGTPSYLSPDGRVLAGVGYPPCVVDGSCASETNVFFEWSEGSGMRNLGTLPGYDFCRVTSTEVSYAPMLTGTCHRAGGFEPFIWTEADGTRGLGAMPAGIYTGPNAVSEDAEVALFEGRSPSDTYLAWRWTTNSGASEFLPTAGYNVVQVSGFRSSMSADGSVAIGSLVGDTSYRGARLTSQGVEELPLLDGFALASPVGMSRDGRTIAGTTAPTLDDYPLAVVWRGDNVELVSDALAAEGVTPGDGLTLRSASVFPSGVLVGEAETASGTFAWIAQLP